MKTQRRQDLKTNELSVYLQQVGEYVRKNASALILCGVILIASVGSIGYWSYNSKLKREQGWRAFQDASLAMLTPDAENPEWVSDITAQWEALLADHGDSILGSLAAWRISEFCLRQFTQSSDAKIKNDLLAKAERNCQWILSNELSSSTFRAAALNGLALVEQNRFVLDDDLAHKEKSRSYLMQIRNDAEFLGTPFQADVLTQLNEFDTLWEPIALLEEAPAPSIPPASDQDDESGPSLSSTTDESESASPSTVESKDEPPVETQEDSGEQATPNPPPTDP